MGLTLTFLHIKVKAIHVLAWTGPEGSRRMSLPDFKIMAHEGSKVVIPTHRPHLTPRKYSWYSFLVEAESIPEANRGRKDYLCQ